MKGLPGKRSVTPSRDGSGRNNKSHKTSNTETYSQSKRTSTSSTSYTTPDRSKPRGEVKCTRCWQNTTNHNYRNCTEAKCICGQSLTTDQSICYNYENHPVSAKFADGMPKMLARILEAYKRGSAGGNNQNTHQGKSKSMTTRSKSKKASRAMSATVAEDSARRVVTSEILDRES